MEPKERWWAVLQRQTPNRIPMEGNRVRSLEQA
jgi:hypothetical protein